jgi:hypothetical protein
MSACGPQPTFLIALGMSAFGGKADTLFHAFFAVRASASDPKRPGRDQFCRVAEKFASSWFENGQF